MQASPVKYSSDAPPQVIVMIMLKEPIQQSPHMKVMLVNPSTGKSHMIDARLPVALSKFTEPVDMPEESFNKFWDDITHNRPSTFQKIDVILKNPAPQTVPHTEVLKKIINFFQNSMNLKVYAQANMDNFYIVKAVGEINFKPTN